MKLQHTGNNVYMLKVSLVFAITLLLCHYLSIGTHSFTHAQTMNGYSGLVITGGKSIFHTGLQFIFFSFSLFAANPRFQRMLESAAVIFISQTIFFTLSINDQVSISNFIIEMLVAVSILCVLMDNFFSGKIKGPRIGYCIAFGIVYGTWSGNFFKSPGYQMGFELENILAISTGLIAVQCVLMLLAFLFFGKLLSGNSRYRDFVVLPFTTVALLGTGFLLYRQFFG